MVIVGPGNVSRRPYLWCVLHIEDIRVLAGTDISNVNKQHRARDSRHIFLDERLPICSTSTIIESGMAGCSQEYDQSPSW
jgi:hypothetical protein